MKVGAATTIDTDTRAGPVPRGSSNGLPQSLAAQDRLAAARGEDRRGVKRMKSTRKPSIPKNTMRTRLKAAARMIANAAARVMREAQWLNLCSYGVVRRARELIMSTASGSVEHVENAAQSAGSLDAASDMASLNHGATASFQGESNGSSASNDTSTQDISGETTVSECVPKGFAIVPEDETIAWPLVN